MDELAARGIGFPVESARVPIVVGACLFDLLVGQNAHPDAAMGRAAARAAFEREAAEPLAEGNVGAGCGASVGKLLGGERAMKAGLGICGLRLGELTACAVVAVNALGNVRSADGAWIAGCRDGEGRVMDPLEAFGVLAQRAAAHAEQEADPAEVCANTTIGVVLTNARLTKAQATKASTVHDAYAPSSRAHFRRRRHRVHVRIRRGGSRLRYVRHPATRPRREPSCVRSSRPRALRVARRPRPRLLLGRAV
ncbi:MAG: P1 family peptidase [Eggerthella lenta]